MQYLWRCLAEARVLPEPPVGDGRPHAGVHVGRGGDDLRRGHLLHRLQGFLALSGVKVGGGALAWYLHSTLQ